MVNAATKTVPIGAMEALAAGGLGAAGSIPVSLSSNQGLLQTIVNAILAGGGASAGALAGGGMATNPVAGAVVGGALGGSLGQVGGNILVNDRNEYAIGNLAQVADTRDITNERVMLQNELFANALSQAVDKLSDSKKEKFMEEFAIAQDIANARQDAVRQPIGEPLSQGDAAKTEAIVRSIIGNPSYVIT